MSQTSTLNEMMENSHGYLLAARALDVGISRAVFSTFVKDNGLERVAAGIYIADDVVLPDELFILQSKCKEVIFSGETALYLHSLTDREYNSVTVNVPASYNATHLKKRGIKVFYSNDETHELGVCEVQSISKNFVRAYDRERCICDTIKNRKNIEVQKFQTALKEYMRSKEKRLGVLVEYAKKLGIRDEVTKYIEVMV